MVQWWLWGVDKGLNQDMYSPLTALKQMRECKDKVRIQQKAPYISLSQPHYLLFLGSVYQKRHMHFVLQLIVQGFKKG